MENDRIKIKSAWLISWDWDGDAAAKVDEVITILNYRYSNKVVERIVQQLYNRATSSLYELAVYAKNEANVTYKAESSFDGTIFCAKSSNPFVHARLVNDICIYENVGGFEVIEWTEPPKREPSYDAPGYKNMTEPQRKKIVRSKQGVLSDESAWNRAESRFKTPEELRP